MDRYWLITWTCYGQWLPGDERGFVGNVRDDEGTQVRHNIPGTPYDENLPALKRWVTDQMKGEPVTLVRSQAEVLLTQYQETARIRHGSLEAASVMSNHTHIIVGVPGDPEPQTILDTLKSWATRALKKIGPLPSNGTFWTQNGSKRKLPDAAAQSAAVVYVVKKQPNPLAVYHDPRWAAILEEYDRQQESRVMDERE